MFLKIWNFLRGYVIIQVSGFSVERFMNLAVYKGVYLWNINYISNNVSMNVSVKGFKLLKSCAKKTGCRFKIIKKRGLPFIFYKYRKRKALVFGVLFFIFALYFLSSFVWVVEVGGNARVETEKILMFAEDFGLKPGSFKSFVNSKKLTGALISQFSDISWAAVEITGTCAKINIVETIPRPILIDKNIPCDIVAKKDGLIVSIVASSGTPLVKPKDVVQKGDVLISNEVHVREDENGVVIHNTHAYGQVKAKLVYELILSESYEYTDKVYTDTVKSHIGFSVLYKKFNIIKPGIPFANYDKITNEKFLNLGFGIVLPFSLITDEYHEYTNVTKTRSKDELVSLLTKMVDLKLESSFDENVELVDVDLSFIEEKDKLYVKALITTIERIDMEKVIN